MINKYVQKCSESLDVKEIQIKTKMRDHDLPPVRIIIIKCCNIFDIICIIYIYISNATHCGLLIEDVFHSFIL